MRNVSIFFLCIAAVSCSAADATESLPTEALAACGSFTACGGDLEGNWEITDGCFSIMTVSGGPAIPACPLATMEYLPDAAGGAYTFESDGRYSAQFELVGRLVLTVPTSCLASGASCATLEGADATRTCVLTANRTCRCTELFEQSIDQPQTGSYELQASRIDFSNDISMTYCAQGDQLTLETVSEVEMGDRIDGRLRFVLERR